MYIELHAASAFSFLDGASLPEVLVDRAAELGYPVIALLDRDGLYGAPRFHKAAKAAGMRAIVGAEVTMNSGQRAAGSRQLAAAGGQQTADSRQPSRAEALLRPLSSSSTAKRPRSEQDFSPAQSAASCQLSAVSSSWSLPLLVESAEGYHNLSRLLTRMHLRSPKGEGALTLEDLDGHTAGLVTLIGREALSGGRHGVGGLVDRLVGLFGRSNVYVELQRHLIRDEEADNQALADLASAFRVPVVATNGVRFARPEDRPLFDVLTCIRHRTNLEAAGRRLAFNAERFLKPPSRIEELFRDRPDAIANGAALADRLRYTMADLGYKFPEYPVPPGETMASFLRKMTDIGARERYRPYHDRARAQIARELALIEKLDLAGYFLIVWDIVNFCRQQGILVQGRGSAANSAVCYSLGITAVDPVGMDLLFERFLSEERGEWPDIDLDLPSGDRRECVIQHVYEKYGQQGAAMTANVITYRGRSAAREVGKALGIEPAQVDRLSKVMHNFEFKDDGETLAKHLDSIGMDAAQPRMRLFAELWQRIQDLPRHLGQHSGGMVICQGRLDGVVPLENASMPGRVVVQWDKDDCADMGIVKIDLLGLGMMAVLQDSLALINSRQAPGSPPLGLWNLPPDDREVYRMLQAADTMGVFQVESRAQMATLPRLKPERFYDIVVEVAIIRPGPIVGQMVHPYLNRRAGREPVRYPHPSLEPILARTLGVPLFQEQLLRIAMVAAGFSGGQAEELRRAFGFKRSERRMQQIEVQLREGMARKGITGEAADGIVQSITSFALYGFPESHSASFALLVYASAYLKAHYPAAFYAGLLNNQPMGFYHPATLVKDAQRRGVRFAPVDVQRSDWDCTIEEDGTVRLGLRYVSGLRQEVGMKIGGRPLSRTEVLLRPMIPGSAAGDHRLAQDFSAADDHRSRQGFTAADDHRSRQGFTAADDDHRSRQGFTAADDHRSRQGFSPAPPRCPKCHCDDASMLERVVDGRGASFFCNNCAHEWKPAPLRFRSIEELVTCSGLNREELSVLAEIGALNAFGYTRREALWQVERVIRPAGELYEEADSGQQTADSGSTGNAVTSDQLSVTRGKTTERRADSGPFDSAAGRPRSGQAAGSGSTDNEARSAPFGYAQGAVSTRRTASGPYQRGTRDPSPLPEMNPVERVVADYAGTGLTIGPHPMALRREEMRLRGALRASDLPHQRDGRRVRVAGAVITRQRPGTAKGFVFLTLEDETGIANIIVRPDLFVHERGTIIQEPFLLVEGTLQNQDGVTSVRAERLIGIASTPIDLEARDFH